MTKLRDHADARRYELDLPDQDGQLRPVWADYATEDDVRLILHVEAAPELRGAGAASRFMQRLVEHARAEELKLRPICGFARWWFGTHPEAADVLAP